MADGRHTSELVRALMGSPATIPHSTSRPPRVCIPSEVLGSGQLPSFMARLAVDHGPIFSFLPEVGPLAGRRVVYLVGPEANRFVLLTHREYFSHDLGWTPIFGDSLGKGLANMDPPEHSRHRALMSPAFTAAFMDQYLPLISRVIAKRARDWAERGEVDLTMEAREISFDIAAGALLGLETGAEVEFLRERFYALLRQPPHEDSEQGLAPHERTRNELDSRLLQLIAARRQSALRDLPNVLDVLVQARDEQGRALSDEQLLAHVNILLVAGHETTTNLAAWLLYLLATHPQFGLRVDEELGEQRGRPDEPITSEAVRGLPVLTNAIRETGRLKPPVMFLPRVVLTEFEFGGYFVPAGTPVFLAIAAGHRLATVFTDPDTFDPDRFFPPREEDKRHPYALVTFGGGPRICLGLNLAHMEVKALVADVRRRYRLIPVSGREIAQIDGVVQCLPDGIRVRVVPGGFS